MAVFVERADDHVSELKASGRLTKPAPCFPEIPLAIRSGSSLRAPHATPRAVRAGTLRNITQQGGSVVFKDPVR